MNEITKKEDNSWNNYLSDLDSCMKNIKTDEIITYNDKYNLIYIEFIDRYIPKNARYICNQLHFSHTFVCSICGSEAKYRLFKMCCGMLYYSYSGRCVNCNCNLNESDKSYREFIDLQQKKAMEIEEKEQKQKAEEEAKKQSIKKQTDLESDYLMLALGTVCLGLISIGLIVAILISIFVGNIQIMSVAAVILIMSICGLIPAWNGFKKKGKEIDKAGFDPEIQKEINTESNFGAACFGICVFLLVLGIMILSFQI